jgi:two-component system phosphate regulon response regulator OmpR
VTRPERERRLVVVAEDDHDLRELVGGLLSGDGFDVETVRDGEELLACLNRRRTDGRAPSVVVTDHRMPGLTAIDVLDMIDRDEPAVIVLTAYGDLVAAEAIELGARAVFHEPFDPDDLRTAVLQWARASETRASP